MLRPTELVYLAAPFDRPEERAFNQRLAKVVRSYNFPLFMPEEAQELLLENGGFLPDWQPGPTLGDMACTLETLENFFMEACMDAINRANLVISVFYGEEYDALSAFETGYAIGRRTNVVAIQNQLVPPLSRPGRASRLSTPQLCSRVIIAPHNDEDFPDRLIPILNRYYVPHKL